MRWAKKKTGEPVFSYASMAPGPDDRPRAGPVTRLVPLGMGRYAFGDASGAQDVIDIVEATPDVLRLARR